MGKKEDEEDEVKKQLDAANRLMDLNRNELAYIALKNMNEALDKQVKKAEEEKKAAGKK